MGYRNSCDVTLKCVRVEGRIFSSKPACGVDLPTFLLPLLYLLFLLECGFRDSLAAAFFLLIFFTSLSIQTTY